MSESTGISTRIDEADMEVELSAQELIALSDVPHNELDETAATSQLLKSATSALPRSFETQRASSPRHASTWRISVSAIATVGIVMGAVYVFTNSERTIRSTATTPQLTAQSRLPEPEQLPGGEPVRFANPFDTTEVFEFPPGTTENEARDAVAELLLQRAISRQKT